MAKPTDLAEVVSDALDQVPHSPRKTSNRELLKARRVKAVSLALAGVGYPQIGEQLGISESGARDLVTRTLSQAENRAVDERRAVENSRLDRAQTAIWSKVLEGDYKAINTFLRISDQRSKINGLYAPTNVNLNVSVKNEMESALEELEALVLENLPEGEDLPENVTEVAVLEDSVDEGEEHDTAN